jgi:deoxyadenosine/deoxycytidine kinase
MKISIEGISGSGKTTLLKLLKIVDFDVQYLEDDIWKALFKENAKKYACGFGLYKLSQHMDVIRDTKGKLIQLYEGSPFTLKNVWIPFLEAEGWLHSEEAQTECNMIDKNGWVPDCIIYLDSYSDKCCDKIDYLEKDSLQRLWRRYEMMLDNNSKNIPIYRINANTTMGNIFYAVLQILYQIQIHNNMYITKPIFV